MIKKFAMKQIKYILFGLVCVMAISCKKDFLDTKPGNQVSDADVWKNPDLAMKVIYGAYNSLPNGHVWFMMMSNTDEGFFRYEDLANTYTHGLVTPLNLGSFGDNWASGQVDYSWAAVYRNLRNINTAIANLDQVPFKTQEDKDRAKADAYFLRGYSYFLLMAQFGGVILYDEKPVEFGSDYKVARNTFEETVSFIVADLDRAIALYSDAEIGVAKTRGDKGVAMAVKAKVLLYAASDLHNSTKNAAVIPDTYPKELVSYIGGDAAARWKAAKDAAKAVIDLNKYSLHTATADKVRNFEEVFVKRGNEDIFLRYWDQQGATYWTWNRTTNINSPAGYGGSPENVVLGNLVDAFEMSDGSKFDWNNPAHKANPYANRDPRLYASVLFEGADWFDRPATANKIRVGNLNNQQVGPDGAFTNYFLRKYFDSNADPSILTWDGSFYSCPPWVRMRYAEVLLNYAEACIELGEDAEARTYINMVRARAGMPPVTESGAALKERYRNERRVELAFEEQRFFDVRRWLTGPESAEDGYGVEVTYSGPNFADPVYKKVLVDDGRTWVNKAYFIPMGTDEMNKNKALQQNPGY
jgi:hypothetical protein